MPALDLMRIYSPGDPIQSLLNCYVLCSGKFDNLFNLLQDEDTDQHYGQKSQAFRELLDNDASPEQVRAEIDSVDDDADLVPEG